MRKIVSKKEQKVINRFVEERGEGIERDSEGEGAADAAECAGRGG